MPFYVCDMSGGHLWERYEKQNPGGLEKYPRRWITGRPRKADRATMHERDAPPII